MGILVNENQIGGGGSNTSHNIGDIFYTTRTDNSLNGAVECNGSQYNFSDFDSNLQALFDEGKLPYLPIGKFDEMVTNQGGCDSFGYGTSNMVQIYPIGNDTEPAQMYIELTDQQFESFNTILSQCNDGDILPYRLYDIDTKELLEGYYIKCIVATSNTGAHFQAYDNNNDEFGYFVNEPIFQPDRINGEFIWYETIPDPDISQASPTTYFKVPKKLSRVLVRTQKPTVANDYTWYNVYADGWVEQGGYVDVSDSSAVSTTYPIELKDTVCPDVHFVYGFQSDIFVKEQQVISMTTTGFSTRGRAVNDTNKVWENADFYWRVVGYADPTEYTKDKWNYQNIQVERCMVQLFNSTTDTAVATCNQVLADVSALNQGDYVIYWDSYEASNHSHAYTGITLAEYQWYRIYKSGWVEQGGFNRTNGSNATRITIPVEMKSVNYTPVIQGRTEENGYMNAQWQVMPVNNTTSSTTTTSFVAQGSITGYNLGFKWQVSGFSFLA